MKRGKRLNKRELESAFGEVVLGRLKEVPFLHCEFVAWNPDWPPDLSGFHHDGILRLRLPMGDVVAAVEIRPTGEISHVRQARLHFAQWQGFFVNVNPNSQAGTLAVRPTAVPQYLAMKILRFSPDSAGEKSRFAEQSKR